jgi:two-component system, chemotaxis family, sensor kinase CheA
MILCILSLWFDMVGVSIGLHFPLMTNQKTLDEEILKEFILDGREAISESEDLLLGIMGGGDSDSTETISAVFRAFHSLKGGAGFLSLKGLARLAHEAETLLETFRMGESTCGEEHVESLCRVCDLILELLITLEDGGGEESYLEEMKECAGLLKSLANNLPSLPSGQLPSLSSGQDSGEASQVKVLESSGPATLEVVQECLRAVKADLLIMIQFPEETESVNSALGTLERFFALNLAERGTALIPDAMRVDRILRRVVAGEVNFSRDLGFLQVQLIDLLLQLLVATSAEEDLLFCELEGLGHQLESLVGKEATTLVESLDLKPEASLDSPSVPSPSVIPPVESQKGVVKREDIRVDMNKLNLLVDIVGELVIAQDMVLCSPEMAQVRSEKLERRFENLEKLTRELQELSLTLRMVPVAPLFGKMKRVVYDTARKVHKKINLVLAGEDTRLDKRLVELLADPLLHIVRNSVDHGIESVEEREEIGKPEMGTITLKATQEGNEITISISDDGGGLNREAILRKAHSQGLALGLDLTSSDNEIFKLIFLPGFSTADQVSEVSGRGVGMDVVNSNVVEKLHGRIEVESQDGEGSTFKLKIPATLSIVEGMIVSVGSRSYALPLLSLRESLQVGRGEIRKTVDGQELLYLRGQLVPVLRLHEFHGITNGVTEIEKGILMVVGGREARAAILVDQIEGQQQMVIKPLATYRDRERSLSGCTILGSGEISLVLDIEGLLRSVVERSRAVENAG